MMTVVVERSGLACRRRFKQMLVPVRPFRYGKKRGAFGTAAIEPGRHQQGLDKWRC